MSTPVSDFRQAADAAVSREPRLAWLTGIRDKAIERFSVRGFPTTADEDWRYTDLQQAAELAAGYARHPPEPATPHTDAAIRERLVSAEASAVVVFTDGTFRQGLSRQPATPGLAITTLSQATGATRARLADMIGTDAGNGGLAGLNAALLREGLIIEVAPGTDIAAPIYVALCNAVDGATSNRIMVLLGDGSRATVIEHHVSLGASFANSVTDIACGPESQLTYVKLQDESQAAFHIASQRVSVARDARADLLHLDLGARLARNDLFIDLAGPNGEVTAHGLFFADGSRHLDNHTRIDHRAPGTVSRELYRGILDGKGRGVFNGKVIVHQGANKTDAQLRNQNLLLSRTAEVDTKPELEIYADDVKCSHGATTGQLDANAVFYLRSRGIPADQARRMLIASFAREIVRRVPSESLDEHVVFLLRDRLPEIREVTGHA